MKNTTRRSFIKGTAAAGITLGGPMVAFAANEAALADLDRPLAKVLSSYGSVRSVETADSVVRISMEAKGFGPLADSFDRFTRLSDLVRVENDNVEFRRGNTTYLIKNRIV